MTGEMILLLGGWGPGGVQNCFTWTFCKLWLSLIPHFFRRCIGKRIRGWTESSVYWICLMGLLVLFPDNFFVIVITKWGYCVLATNYLGIGENYGGAFYLEQQKAVKLAEWPDRKSQRRCFSTCWKNIDKDVFIAVHHPLSSVQVSTFQCPG